MKNIQLWHWKISGEHSIIFFYITYQIIIVMSHPHLTITYNCLIKTRLSRWINFLQDNRLYFLRNNPFENHRNMVHIKYKHLVILDLSNLKHCYIIRRLPVGYTRANTWITIYRIQIKIFFFKINIRFIWICLYVIEICIKKTSVNIR